MSCRSPEASTRSPRSRNTPFSQFSQSGSLGCKLVGVLPGVQGTFGAETAVATLPYNGRVVMLWALALVCHCFESTMCARQHHGVWEREFLFEHSDGRFELCEEEADLENGVLTVVLKFLGRQPIPTSLLVKGYGHLHHSCSAPPGRP